MKPSNTFMDAGSLLEITEMEEGVLALGLPIGLFKKSHSRYRDANPVPTSPLADNTATAPYESVL